MRELEEHLKHRPDLNNVQRTIQGADVVIIIEFENDQPTWVEVSDRGTGQAVGVVTDVGLFLDLLSKALV